MVKRIREEWWAFKSESFIAEETTNFVSVPESLIAALDTFMQERFGEYEDKTYL